jgi:hypothetical protein
MYAIVIIPRCFVFCMFLYKFHVLWARATSLFSDSHVEISTLGFFCTELFHEFVAFIYAVVITLYCFVFMNLNIYGWDVYVVRIYIYFALVLVLVKMHV